MGEVSIKAVQAGAEPAELVEVFRRVGLLVDLGDDEAAEVVRHLKPRRDRFADGYQICRSGDDASCMWIVVSGSIRVLEKAEGQDRYVAMRSAGVIVGETALFRAAPKRTASLVTAGAVDVIVIDYDCFEALKDLGRWEVVGPLYRDFARISAGKLAEATTHRAGLAANAVYDDALLRRFVPEYGLSATRATDNGIRAEYSRDHVVFLFSDVAGFSEMAERIGPDETAALIKSILDAQARAVGEFGGQIDKFIGDAVMAFWTVPGGEASARRACSSAFSAAVKAVRATHDIRNPVTEKPIEIRIGLHIGSAFSGNYGSSARSAFTFIGHDVNVAARLEQARSKDIRGGDAELGSIRASAAFHFYLGSDDQKLLPHKADVQVKTNLISMYSGGPP